MTKSQLTQQTQTLTGLAQIPADATPHQPWAPEIQGLPDPEAPQNQTGKNHPLIFHPGQYTGWTLGRLKKKRNHWTLKALCPTSERWHLLRAQPWRGHKDDLVLCPALKGGCRPDKGVRRYVTQTQAESDQSPNSRDMGEGQLQFRGRKLTSSLGHTDGFQKTWRMNWVPLWVYSNRGQALTCPGVGSLCSMWTTYFSDCPSSLWARLPAIAVSGHLYFQRPVCLLFFFPGHIAQWQTCSQQKFVYFHKKKFFFFLKFTNLFTTGN